MSIRRDLIRRATRGRLPRAVQGKQDQAFIEALATELFHKFCGRADLHAVEHGDGFRPTKRPLTAIDLRQHVAGKRCFGFYLMRPDSTVSCTAVDFDGRHEPDWRGRAKAVRDCVRSLGITPLVEVSQSGNGAHVWVFLERPEPAARVRQWWESILAVADVKCREIFPRQVAVVEGGYGNLLRYPYWRDSRFVDDAWRATDPLAALRKVKPARLVLPEVTAIKHELPASVRGLVGLADIKRRWEGDASGLKDQTPSGVAMSLVCGLIRHYVPTEDIRETLRAWGLRRGYEKTQRADWLERTLGRAYDFIRLPAATQEGPPATMAEHLARYLMQSGEDDDTKYCPFGIKEWDDAHRGVAFGEFAMLAARPSHGKTMLALQWADEQAARGIPTTLISEEMSPLVLAERYAIRHSMTNKAVDKTGEIKRAAEHWQGRAPLYVHTSCNTVQRVEDVIHARLEQHNARAVIIDYLQLLRVAGSRSGWFEQIGIVGQRLVTLTRRLNVAMLVVASLSRMTETREGAIPRLSDLALSGQLEYQADTVVAIRRPWQDDRTSAPEQLFVYTLKRRNGDVKQPIIETTIDAAQMRIA